MSKFKVGDKVRSISWQEGVCGTITKSNGQGFEVEADEGQNVQNPFWVINGKRGFYHFATELEMIEQPRREFIVIRRSGAETIAELRHDREVIKSAVATCSEKDTFDFDTGAKIAFDKLTGRYVKPAKEPKPAPQPAHRFKVGDRVLVGGYEEIGEVSAIDQNDNPVPYLVSHASGCHGGGCYAEPSKSEHAEKCSWFSEERLSPAPAPEPPKFYTGKVVCVEWKGDIFRHTNTGRIAMVTNGISDYNGWNRMSKPFESFSDFCSANTHGVFHEIKE